MSRKSVVHVPSLPTPRGVWSNALIVEPRKLLFIAGLLARDSAGKIVGVGDIRLQTRQVCENLKSTVQAAGGTLADLVRIDVFITDMTMFDDIHAVRREYFPHDPPVSTMVEIKRFTDKDALIEINAIAALE